MRPEKATIVFSIVCMSSQPFIPAFDGDVVQRDLLMIIQLLTLHLPLHHFLDLCIKMLHVSNF